MRPSACCCSRTTSIARCQLAWFGVGGARPLLRSPTKAAGSVPLSSSCRGRCVCSSQAVSAIGITGDEPISLLHASACKHEDNLTNKQKSPLIGQANKQMVASMLACLVTILTENAKARLRRTASSYYNIDSLAEEQWPTIGEEGVFTRSEAHAEHHGFLLWHHI